MLEKEANVTRHKAKWEVEKEFLVEEMSAWPARDSFLRSFYKYWNCKKIPYVAQAVENYSSCEEVSAPLISKAKIE